MKQPPLRKILDWYDAWLREERVDKVAAALETTTERVRHWLKTWPQFAEAKALADERRTKGNTFDHYVFSRLSKEAQKAWEDIEFWADDTGALEKVNAILAGKSTRLRQELFVHALVHSSFDVSTALKMVCISRVQYDNWRANDLGFKQLIEEIQWHKKNFFEKQLVGLIEEKHPAAVIFANKTMNADRGYNEKIQLEHSGKVGMEASFSFEDLELDLETRKKVLAAIRIRQMKLAGDPQKALPPPNREIIDAVEVV